MGNFNLSSVNFSTFLKLLESIGQISRNFFLHERNLFSAVVEKGLKKYHTHPHIYITLDNILLRFHKAIHNNFTIRYVRFDS